MAKGRKSFEGSAQDVREDKAQAKKRGMTMDQWEASAADVKQDKPKKAFASGGSVKGKARGVGCALRGY